MQIWDAFTRGKLIVYQYHLRAVTALAWSPDSKHIASASGDSTVQVWNATSGKTIFTYKHAAPVYTVAWSPDGKYITSGGDDKTVQVWVAP